MADQLDRHNSECKGTRLARGEQSRKIQASKPAQRTDAERGGGLTGPVEGDRRLRHRGHLAREFGADATDAETAGMLNRQIQPR
jgi:hypothetical protein